MGRKSVVVSFRIPAELKARMDRLKHINWSEEVRAFPEERVREHEAREVLRRVRRELEGVPTLPRGTVRGRVRAGRDSH